MQKIQEWIETSRQDHIIDRSDITQLDMATARKVISAILVKQIN